MLTKRLTYLLILLAATLAGQAQDSLLLRDYRTVRLSDAWLGTTNAAAQTRLTAPNIVEADGCLSMSRGGLVNYDDAAKQLQASVSVESIYRLSRRVVAYGAIGYDNWTGQDMTGAALYSPISTLSPFTIVEDSLTNAGDKHRDTYRLTGGVGVDLWHGVALGARLDYTAGNYAKYKDLRHKNKLMDLRLDASLYAPITGWLSVGADYVYHRQTQSVSFGTYGKSEKVYKSLIDYGAFMGMVEQFGNDGYTDRSREMPLFEDGHGGSLQIELRPTDGLAIMGSGSLNHGSGYYGRQSPYTITYTRHSRNHQEAALAIGYRQGSSLQRLDIAAIKEKVESSAETYRELTNDGGAYYYEYYDPVETGNKEYKNLHVAYTALIGLHSERPTWALTAAYDWWQRQQVAYLYPYYRQQLLSASGLSASIGRNLFTRHGVWSITVDGAYQKGTGDPYRDGTLATPSSRQPDPATMDAFLYREYLYLTAPQYAVGAGLNYAFLLPGTNLATHIGLRINHRKANATNDFSTGRDHTTAALTIGCTF